MIFSFYSLLGALRPLSSDYNTREEDSERLTGDTGGNQRGLSRDSGGLSGDSRRIIIPRISDCDSDSDSYLIFIPYSL